MYKDEKSENLLHVNHKKYGSRQVVFQPSPGGFGDDDSEDIDDIDPVLLFTDNESNLVKLFNEKKIHQNTPRMPSKNTL